MERVIRMIYIGVRETHLRVITLKRPFMDNDKNVIIEPLRESFLAESRWQGHLLGFVSRSSVLVCQRELDAEWP